MRRYLTVSIFSGLFFASIYLGFNGARITAFRYKQSTAFNSLGPRQAQPIREIVQTLGEFEMARFATEYSQASLKQNVSDMQGLRLRAPSELWPIIDLRIAVDDTVLWRLERETHNLDESEGHKRAAAALFRSLGWLDVSDKVVAEVAEQQLRSTAKE